MVDIEKDDHESLNDYTLRKWFILKNLNKKTCLDELILLSHIYINMVSLQCSYCEDLPMVELMNNIFI